MAKPHIVLNTKGKWLELDPRSESTENILTVVRKIDGADILVVSGKTYVRFPANQVQKEKHFTKMIKTIVSPKRSSTIEARETSNLGGYCAVMLKAEK